MEFNDVILGRYSCRSFKKEQVSDAALQKILLAGRAAPTAKNLQEQKIYVLRSEASLAAVDSVTHCRRGAPTVLAVAWDKTNVYTYPGGKRDSGAEDATIVATHMILAACNEGVDSCWLNAFDPDAMKQALHLPENEELLMLLDLGYAAEDTAPSPNHAARKELTETVRYL